MADYIFWFALSIILVAVEMTTGTFYILVIALAAAGGGLAAVAGLSLPIQIATAATIGALGVLTLHRIRAERLRKVGPDTYDLDIGFVVKPEKWTSDTTLRVKYRGAHWDAELVGPEVDRDGKLVITGKRGSALLLANPSPAIADTNKADKSQEEERS